jgi:arabinose-5-phosphate isomerase
MSSGERIPVVKEGVSVKDALFVITGKGYGTACVVDENDNLTGIFTDGDLRRLMERVGVDAFSVKIEDAMTKKPKTIQPDSLAAEAVKIIEQYEVSVLIAVENHKPVGIIHIHDLLKAGIA